MELFTGAFIAMATDCAPHLFQDSAAAAEQIAGEAVAEVARP